MAITPTQNDALLREIDDAVRQDDMLSIWKNYGRIIIGVVILGLAAFGGWLYWQHHQTKVAEENSVQFASLLTAAQRATLDQPGRCRLCRRSARPQLPDRRPNLRR